MYFHYSFWEKTAVEITKYRRLKTKIKTNTSDVVL